MFLRKRNRIFPRNQLSKTRGQDHERIFPHQRASPLLKRHRERRLHPPLRCYNCLGAKRPALLVLRAVLAVRKPDHGGARAAAVRKEINQTSGAGDDHESRNDAGGSIRRCSP